MPKPKNGAAHKRPAPTPAPKGEMRIDWVSLDDLARAPRNPKLHEIPVIEESFRRFGFVSPPILDERTGRLVAGHGRLEALLAQRAAGLPPPDRIRKDVKGRWLVPVIKGVSFGSDVEAEQYVITDNRATVVGGWDEAMLGQMISSMSEEQRGAMTALGWSDKELDKLAAGLGTEEGAKVPVSFAASSEAKQHKCPACGHQWSGKSR